MNRLSLLVLHPPSLHGATCGGVAHISYTSALIDTPLHSVLVLDIPQGSQMLSGNIMETAQLLTITVHKERDILKNGPIMSLMDKPRPVILPM